MISTMPVPLVYRFVFHRPDLTLPTSSTARVKPADANHRRRLKSPSRGVATSNFLGRATRTPNASKRRVQQRNTKACRKGARAKAKRMRRRGKQPSKCKEKLPQRQRICYISHFPTPRITPFGRRASASGARLHCLHASVQRALRTEEVAVVRMAGGTTWRHVESSSSADLWVRGCFCTSPTAALHSHSFSSDF